MPMDTDAHVVAVKGPLSAEAIIDAHLATRAIGKALHIHHEGAPTKVAQRTAARFGITLVDVTPWVAAAPADIAPADLAPAPPGPAPGPTGPPSPPSLVDEGSPALPWTPQASASEPVPEIIVPEAEFEAMPWNVVHHTLLPAGRQTRPGTPRPSMTPQDWGLPWPRPVVPMDGIAKSDPRLWQSQERIQAIREDLERAGAPSFGATKPDGSAWLKRISEFGSP